MNDALQHRLILHLPLSEGFAGLGPLHRLVNHNVRIGDGYATFNGHDSFLEIDGGFELRCGDADFTIAAQIWTERDLVGAVGDLFSCFDPAKRRGFNLSVKHHAGAVTSQTNFKNLHFEADDGTNPVWSDCGRVGNASAVWSLAVHKGALYAGTYEQAAEGSGRVFRYQGSRQWESCGMLDGSNTVSALAVWDGQLYAATKTEDPHGSLLEPTGNHQSGGNVYRLNRDDTWTHCGKVCEQNNIFGMTVFRGSLYAWPAYAKGVYRYEGATSWARISSPDSRLLAMAPFHGALYATANRLALLDPNAVHAGPHGDPTVQAVVGKYGAYRLNNDGSWSGLGNQAQETQIYSTAIHCGQMYVGTWPNGKVFQYRGGMNWHDCGRLGEETEVMGLAVYNGKLYAGGLPNAAIYRFDGDHEWTRVGQVDTTPAVPLRRAINMAVYQGRMFVGTLPSGHVWAMETGQVASHDYELPSGWHSIAARRREGRLYLYIDGYMVACSRNVHPSLDLRSHAPVRIGFGQHDYFNGRMRDVRIYDRALEENEIVLLAVAHSSNTTALKIH